MKKNQSHKKIFHAFLVACGLFSLMQSAPAHAYSFQDFKTALQQTYPTLDTPLKDLKLFWSYGQKKLTFKPIPKKESKAFWRAVKRTGIPLAVILSIISAGLYAHKKRAPKPVPQEQLTSPKLVDAIRAAIPTRNFTEVNKLINQGIGILGEGRPRPHRWKNILAFLISVKYQEHATIPFETIQALITKLKEYFTPQQFKDYINKANPGNHTILTYLAYIAPTDPIELKIMELLLESGANPNQLAGVSPENALDRYLTRGTFKDPSRRSFMKRKPFIKLLLRHGTQPTVEPAYFMQGIYQEVLNEIKIEEKEKIKRFRTALGHAVRAGTPQEREPEAVGKLPLELQQKIFEYTQGRPVWPLPEEAGAEETE